MNNIKQAFSNIASAIREKNGEETQYKPADMPAAIKAIETSGGEINISGSQSAWADELVEDYKTYETDKFLVSQYLMGTNGSKQALDRFRQFTNINADTNYSLDIKIPEGTVSAKATFIGNIQEIYGSSRSYYVYFKNEALETIDTLSTSTYASSNTAAGYHVKTFSKEISLDILEQIKYFEYTTNGGTQEKIIYIEFFDENGEVIPFTSQKKIYKSQKRTKPALQLKNEEIYASRENSWEDYQRQYRPADWPKMRIPNAGEAWLLIDNELVLSVDGQYTVAAPQYGKFDFGYIDENENFIKLYSYEDEQFLTKTYTGVWDLTTYSIPTDNRIEKKYYMMKWYQAPHYKYFIPYNLQNNSGLHILELSIYAAWGDEWDLQYSLCSTLTTQGDNRLLSWTKYIEQYQPESIEISTIGYNEGYTYYAGCQDTFVSLQAFYSHNAYSMTRGWECAGGTNRPDLTSSLFQYVLFFSQFGTSTAGSYTAYILDNQYVHYTYADGTCRSNGNSPFLKAFITTMANNTQDTINFYPKSSNDTTYYKSGTLRWWKSLPMESNVFGYLSYEGVSGEIVANTKVLTTSSQDLGYHIRHMDYSKAYMTSTSAWSTITIGFCKNCSVEDAIFTLSTLPTNTKTVKIRMYAGTGSSGNNSTRATGRIWTAAEQQKIAEGLIEAGRSYTISYIK